LADNHCSRRRLLEHVRGRQGIQHVCVMSNRLRPIVLGAEYTSTWPSRLISEHTGSHDDPGPDRGNDLSLPGAPVEEKANQADRNLALSIRRRQHHAEGPSR
jgi:hypothetical protein